MRVWSLVYVGLCREPVLRYAYNDLKERHPADGGKTYLHKIPRYDGDFREIVFTGLSNPLPLSPGQELRLWYSEDLRDGSGSNNGGTSCADVYAEYI